MKQKAALLFYKFLLLTCLASAQPTNVNGLPEFSRPELFNNFPAKMKMYSGAVADIFNYAPGFVIHAQLTDHLFLNGTVLSSSVHANGTIKTMLVQSETMKGTTFYISRQLKKDGTVVYRGRMINKNSSDALEMVYESGQYFLKKTQFYRIVGD